ncbi:hypothetical protein L7F22_015656 [Adiantum nelumboides]|nr:hypothetical protein [Adiantum nelumboides]
MRRTIEGGGVSLWHPGGYSFKHADHHHHRNRAICCTSSTWLVMVRKPVGARPYVRELICSRLVFPHMDPLLATTCNDQVPLMAALGGPSRLLPSRCLSFHFSPQITKDHGASAKKESPDPWDSFDVEVYYVIAGAQPSHGLPFHFTPTPQAPPPPFESSACGFPFRLTTRCFCKPQFVDTPGDLEIYNSRSGSWMAGRSCWPGSTDAKVCCVQELEKADLLQFSYGSLTVFGYNGEQDEWSQVCAIGSNRSTLWLPNGVTLLRHGGRILLASVQFINHFRPTGLAGFVVWELHPLANPPRHVALGDCAEASTALGGFHGVDAIHYVDG